MRREVMIVDDDPGILESVTLLLKLRGFTVVQATSGGACLEALRGGFRGVILMDVMMPGMSGWDTIRAMVAEHLLGDNLVCMLTALTEPGADSEGLQESVFDYLPKPFDAQQLSQMVEYAAGYLSA